MLQVGFKAPKKTAKKVVQKAGDVKVPAKKASLAKKSAIKKPVPKKTGAKPKSVGNRAFSCQFFPQNFCVKSESTLVFPSKNLSLERKIATNLNSRQKYGFRTNIEFSRKCIYLQLKPI